MANGTFTSSGVEPSSKPNFQFIQCGSESDAQAEFSSQLHDKNDKRGQWATIAGKRVLQAKPGKDCYLVRPLATRSTGLPDAKTIKLNDGSKKPADESKKPDPSKKKAVAKVDPQTLSLMRDLSVATVAYTKGSMADASLPTQTAINEARDFIQEAQKRVVVVSDNVDDQVNDRQLVDLTNLMYSRVPKKKRLHSPPSEWILSASNILLWQADLDAFESALYANMAEEEHTLDTDPFGGMPIHMEWIDPKSRPRQVPYVLVAQGNG